MIQVARFSAKSKQSVGVLERGEAVLLFYQLIALFGEYFILRRDAIPQSTDSYTYIFT